VAADETNLDATLVPPPIEALTRAERPRPQSQEVVSVLGLLVRRILQRGEPVIFVFERRMVR
jgi:hypothetical protein